MKSLLIANRGEIAIRIARAAAELGLRTVSVYSADDASSLHVRKTDAAVALAASGPAAYLDIAGIIATARQAGCDAVHPGYGFLSENAALARACTEAGLVFVGPDADTLELFGDKSSAKALARDCGVPIADGVSGPASVEDIKKYFASLGAGGAVMIKAVAGGGGRGMRAVVNAADVDEAFVRCQSEAQSFFGNGNVYAERLLRKPRHIEAQIIGDGSGAVSHVWERECTLQRRHQKLVEIAPCPSLKPALRARILDAAVRMAARARYRGLGTFEFLVEGDEFIFIECNARLQVEHTVTEEVTGIDLVVAQLRIASGATLSALGLTQDRIPAPSGHAMQLRINMETMNAAGQAQPTGGVLRVFETPSGRGVRVDSFGYAGYATSSSFDSLLAKLIVHAGSPNYADTVAKAYRALCELRIEGVTTNAGFLRNLLRHPDVIANNVSTTFIEDRIGELLAPTNAPHADLYFAESGAAAQTQGAPAAAPPGTVALTAPMSARIVSVDVTQGQQVRRGQQVAVIEAMKAELVVNAHVTGLVHQVLVSVGLQIFDGHPIMFIQPMEIEGLEDDEIAEVDLDAIRPDLAEVIERHNMLLDEVRPDSVARRRKTGSRTARENIADLVDPDSFVEYGGLIMAMQRSRRTVEELIRISPADGFVSGIARVNGDKFSEEKARCMVLAYDYMVFAGTQGFMAHRKKDRMFELAYKLRVPLILFSEGGGGRPGDSDYVGSGGLELRSFWHFARLSGLIPMIGINSGRCFAGNAALLGCCDVIIATRNSNIGMAGPAMIEGGGLGVFKPEDVGPVSVQEPNGVIDILVEDEVEAVAVAKKYLSYFQGAVTDWSCADQRELRALVPENRLRAYDYREVLHKLADTDSVLELRPNFGIGMLTALVRIEGRPVGVIANNPLHLGGAVDAPGADKASRFMQLCDAFDIPLLMLCDTPGFMVGPESEKTATVRHFSRMFITASTMDVPVFTVVLRKAYGLGAIAMAGGYINFGNFAVSWPTGEVGPMGLEGAVHLAYRNELAAIADLDERQALYKKLVDRMYENGKALNAANYMEIDDVIDPADTRKWIMQGLRNSPAPLPRAGKKRPMVDAW
ncbi:MAG: carbamoyl-phosphate synthase large subunit [Alphaproteobacteria bacterium]|nr:carbamoyl-phosphate synthase large subunit [Alphaproteobacteria bacterium]